MSSKNRVIGILGDDDFSVAHAISEAQACGILLEDTTFINVTASEFGQGSQESPSRQVCRKPLSTFRLNVPAKPPLSFEEETEKDFIDPSLAWKGKPENND